MGVVLTGFTAYHFYLASLNITSNESAKWGDIGDYLHQKRQRDGLTEEELPMPENQYDQGMLKNLAEVFFPKSLYRRSSKPNAEVRQKPNKQQRQRRKKEA